MKNIKPSTIFRVIGPAILTAGAACAAPQPEMPNCSLPEGPTSVTVKLPGEPFIENKVEIYQEGNTWFAAERVPLAAGWLHYHKNPKPLFLDHPYAWEEDSLGIQESVTLLRDKKGAIFLEVTRSCKER